MEWIQSNKHTIPGKVEGPIALSINAKGRSALYLENIVRRDDLKMFICSDSNTCNYLIQKLRYGLNLRINLAVSPEEIPKTQLDMNNLRQFGFNNVLRDLIDGTPMAMMYLDKVYELTRIPINEDDNKSDLQNFLNSIRNIKKFIFGNRCYTVKTSRYGSRTKSSSSFVLTPTKILKESIDEDYKLNLKESIASLISSINSHQELYDREKENLRILREQMNDLGSKKSDLQSKIQGIFALKNQIDIQNNKLSNIESKKSDIADMKAQSEKFVSNILEKKEKAYGLTCESLEECLEVIEKSSNKLSHFLNESREKSALVSNIDQLEDKLKQDKEILNSLKSRYAEVRQRCTEQRSKADEISGIKSGEKLGNDLKAQLNRLSHNLEEIKSQIHSISALNVVNDCSTNEDTIKEYNRFKEDINKMKLAINANETNIKSIKEEMISLKKSWQDRIESIISMISKKYSQFMSKLGYSGEILLNIPDDEFDFPNYGINIMVKYRNEEALQQLNSYHQSGGERSVATILYMLALQDITTVPFRCLDEINQGMDPVNERKIFNMIVNNTCENSNSQYFLLTPKLLKGLNYHENLSIISIFPKAPLITNWDTESYTSILLSTNQSKIA
ncbi:MAG: Structural maintenance of chromosomes protein 5 [Marteilia pararefringens]